MPNWCENTLSISGPEADVQAFKHKARGRREGKVQLLNFNSFVPMPEEFQDGEDWLSENWGCEWEPEDTQIVDCGDWIRYHFFTPWSPPIEFLKTVSAQWPNLTFILAYEELGMGFQGLARFKRKRCEDHCMSLYSKK